MSNLINYCTDSNIKDCNTQCTESNVCAIGNELGSGAQGVVNQCGDNKVVKTSNKEELTGEYEFLNYENPHKDIYVAKMYPVIDNDTCDKKKVVMDNVQSFKTYLKNEVKDNIDLRFLLIRKLVAATAFLNFKIKYSHNDIKPDNIGIHPDTKHIRFIDMGGSIPITEEKGDVYSFKDTEREYTQTLMFSAPIMMENIQDVYVRDRWATACTIYYIVSGGHYMIDTDGDTVNVHNARLFFVLMMLDMDGIEYMLGFINDKPKYVNETMKKSRGEFVKRIQEYNPDQRRLIYAYLIDTFIPNVLSSGYVEQKIKKANEKKTEDKEVDEQVNALFGIDGNKENVNINEQIVNFIEKGDVEGKQGGVEGTGDVEGKQGGAEGATEGEEGAKEGAKGVKSSKKEKNMKPNEEMIKRANQVVQNIRKDNMEKKIDIEYHLERLRMRVMYM